MTRDVFVHIVQSWMRSRGFALANSFGAMPESVERELLLELTDVIDSAVMNSRDTRTHRMSPEALQAAIHASKIP